MNTAQVLRPERRHNHETRRLAMTLRLIEKRFEDDGDKAMASLARTQINQLAMAEASRRHAKRVGKTKQIQLEVSFEGAHLTIPALVEYEVEIDHFRERHIHIYGVEAALCKGDLNAMFECSIGDYLMDGEDVA